MLSISRALVAVALATGAAAVLAGDEPLPDPLAAGWDGESVCEKLKEDSAQRILRCTFPPGGGHEKHFHAPHFGYVITGGTMRITDASGERVVELRSGVTWNSDGVVWHEVLNVGETTSVYLIVEQLDAKQDSSQYDESRPATR